MRNVSEGQRCEGTSNRGINVEVKVEVKFTLEQAKKAQRG
jgi:hypothetical protein